MSRRQQEAANVRVIQNGDGDWHASLRGNEPTGDGVTEAIAAIDLAAVLRDCADKIDAAYRGQANRDALARAERVAMAAQRAAAAPDPRSYLSTSGGLWRLIHDGAPLCADGTEAAAIATAARYGAACDLSHGRVWDGDAGAWRPVHDETRGGYTSEGEAY